MAAPLKTAIILHGTDATPSDNWFPWLKLQLEEKGYQVFVPQLPEANHPNIARYNRFLLSNEREFTFDKDTILVGHSSGAVAILGLLQALPVGTEIGNCYLVSAFTNSLGWEALKDLFFPPLDASKIKGKSSKLTFIHSDDDPYCPLPETEQLAKDIGGELIIKPSQQHFSVKELPFLKDLILNS